jgi:hypothetical protein
MDKEDMIFDLVKGVKEELSTVKEKVEEIRRDQIVQGNLIDQNTTDLSEHKEGVVQNRKRIEYLELPWYIKAFTRANITFVLGVVGSLLFISSRSDFIVEKVSKILSVFF